MLKAHAGKVAAARQIGEGGGVITLGANDRCATPGPGRESSGGKQVLTGTIWLSWCFAWERTV